MIGRVRSSPATGRLVVFEGPEGAGKSTQVDRLAAWLAARDEPVRVVREPGTSAVGTEIRQLLLDPAREIAPATEALLFMAARAELVERELRPALAAGETVLADRFFLATYAYQIGGRGLPADAVMDANRLATGGLVPDLTLLFTLPLAEGMARAERRNDFDRMERAGSSFHERVAAAYATFATPAWQAAHPECGVIATVDASGSMEAVFERVLAALDARWGETFTLARG